MNMRSFLGFAALGIAATMLTGVALDSAVGSSQASAPDADATHKDHATASTTETPHGKPSFWCHVHIEKSNVEGTNICSPGGKAVSNDGKYGASRPSKEPHGPQQPTTVYEKETECEAEALLIATNQCDVDGDANAFSGNLLGVGGLVREAQWVVTGAEGGAGGDGHRKVHVVRDGETECEAEGAIATNQCDVDGDANAFSDNELGLFARDSVGTSSASGGNGAHGGSGGASKARAAHGTEETECEAEALLIATNQCDVGGDANAFSDNEILLGRVVGPALPPDLEPVTGVLV